AMNIRPQGRVLLVRLMPRADRARRQDSRRGEVGHQYEVVAGVDRHEAQQRTRGALWRTGVGVATKAGLSFYREHLCMSDDCPLAVGCSLQNPAFLVEELGGKQKFREVLGVIRL